MRILSACSKCHKIKKIWVLQFLYEPDDYAPSELVCDDCLEAAGEEN